MSAKPVKPITPEQARWVKPIMRVMSRLNVWAYAASNGRVGGRFIGGAPVCLVTTVGRKSGKRRTTPLIHVPHGEDILLVASQGGMDMHPVWYLNLLANPELEVRVGARTRRMIARRASPSEKKELWPHLLSVYPPFDEYQQRTDRDIPLFVCSPA